MSRDWCFSHRAVLSMGMYKRIHPIKRRMNSILRAVMEWLSWLLRNTCSCIARCLVCNQWYYACLIRGQWHYSQRQGVINIALRAAKEGKIFTVWGDGTTTKDYIYAPDMCAFLFRLLEKNAFGEVINLASGELLSVNDILHKIKQLYPNFDWTYQPANAHDIPHVALDTTRLKQIIGDNIQMHSFQETIRTI